MEDLIFKYFPDLNALQREQITRMSALYTEWNSRINVISRKDIESLYLHHVLHSLSIARLVNFLPGSRVLDAGTGGGFPGIPLAVLFPETQFILADSIGKKIRVVTEVAASLGLENVTPFNGRFENVPGSYDFITGRAVSNLGLFASMLYRKLYPTGRHPLPNGILYLTGGDALEETRGIRAQLSTYPVSTYFAEDYFTTKKLIHLHSFH